MSNYYFLWLCTEQWELIYYIAFIILTIGLVIFAAKTYFFQTKQSTKLFCKSIGYPAPGYVSRAERMWLCPHTVG